ncbi:MAG: AAA family ATPase [Patescibacteria group bacterium]
MEQTPNFHKISEQRRTVRHAIREAGNQGVPEILQTDLKRENAALSEQAGGFSIPKDEKGRISFSKAKEFLKRQQRETESDTVSSRIDFGSVEEQIGPAYGTFASLEKDLRGIANFEMYCLRERMTRPGAEVFDQSLEKIKQAKPELLKRLAEEKKAYPTEWKMFELMDFRSDLFREGRIVHTPTVEKYLGEIGKRMIHGKPMFLHGPTGTGKTSLARYAAEHFTGKRAEMVYCTPQTRESHIWGKTGIRAKGEHGAIETVDIYGPLARGIMGGKTVIFDEFTALPKDLMVFIKGVANAKAGDTINIPGNGDVRIEPGFQMIFTANLKSDKNPERQDLPPEIAREFEQNNLEILYTPKDEAYDIMKARLMNRAGGITLSDYDLETTLPKFCEAMEEIQVAYYEPSARDATAQLIGAKDVSGKKPGLKKFVTTQGTVEAILGRWETERQMNGGISFVEFLDQAIKTGITFKEYPENDRMLAAKIFALKGFLRTVTPAELGLPENTFDVSALKKGRDDAAISTMIGRSQKERLITLRELAGLSATTPDLTDAANGLLGAGTGADSGKDTPDIESLKKSNEPFLLETLTKWYSEADAKKAKQEARLEDPKMLDYGKLSADIDVGRFGEYTLNPDTQALDFEQAKVFIPDLSAFVGIPRHEVMKHIIDTYGTTHHIPGIEYWKWILEHQDKAPQSLKDGNWFYLPGSVLRVKGGRWNVPHVLWDGSKFVRRAAWLVSGWGAAERVVLLEK